MKRWLVALTLACGLTADAQPLTGGLLGRGASYSSFVADPSCASGYTPYFNASLKLVCSPTVYAPATDTTTATGTIAARNFTATALTTPVITPPVSPVLSLFTTVTVVAGASLADGDYFTLSDGSAVVYEFDTGDGVTSGRVPIVIVGDETAQAIRDLTIVAINGSTLEATAIAAAADTLTVTSDVAGDSMGVNSENVTDAGFLVPVWGEPTHATTYGYVWEMCTADGKCAPSAEVQTTTGHATLNGANYNSITVGAVAGSAYGKLTRVTGTPAGGDAPPRLLYTGTALNFNDTNATSTSEAVATVNETGRITSDALTPGGVAIVGAGGRVETDAGLTYDAATDTLTSGRVLDRYAGVSGKVAYQPGLAASPSPGFALSRPGSWLAYDAGATGGLVSKRYWGAIYDGRYVYYVPSGGGIVGAAHGVVLRYDTHEDFDSADAWASYDASTTDALATTGYAGGTFDGRYVYFSPYGDGDTVYHGNVLRLDTRGEFTAAASWDAYDASATGALDCRGYRDALYDGQRYVYFSPLRNDVGNHAFVLRYDTAGGFTVAGSWTAYDAGATSALVSKSYKSIISDGRYLYFVPNNTNGVAQTAIHLRYDTALPFTDGGSWSAVSTASTDSLTTKGYSGAVFDGRYIYYIPIADSATSHGRLLRYDTHGAWVAGQFNAFDMGNVGGANLRGYLGGVYDGARYVYMVPYSQGVEDGTDDFHGTWTRYDTTRNFFLTASYEIFDASAIGGLTTEGYAGAAFDGRYIYAAPHQNDAGTHGYALRFDTGMPAPPRPAPAVMKWKSATVGSAAPATITQDGALWELGTTTYAQTGQARGGTYTAPLSRSTGPKWATLTAETATTIATLALNASSVGTADLQVIIQANDATEYQGMAYKVRVNTRRNATGDTVSTVGLLDNAATLPAVAGSGTLTCTFSVVEGATSVAIQATATSSLTETTLRAMADIVSVGANATVTLP